MKPQDNVQVNRHAQLLEKLFGDVRDDTLITGGHFLIDGSKAKELNEGTIFSFKIAVLLYKATKKLYKNVRLGILLNDIGQVCSANKCDISIAKNVFSKNTFTLPQEYVDILHAENVNVSELYIFWEKHMRNRGKKLFNKIKRKRNDISSTNEEYYINDKDGFGDILLLRINAQDKYGTPACPLIMAAYSLEQERLKVSQSLNFYYVSNDNITNIPNHIVIEKGKRVAEMVGSNLIVRNVYLTPEGAMKNY